MWPTVQVNNLNQMQGPANDVERHFLFIGAAAAGAGLLSVNTQTDFDTTFGATSSPLKDNLVAAMLNAGQNWTAHAYVLPAEADWVDAAKEAQATASFEAIVMCDQLSSQAAITAAQALRTALIATWGRWQTIIMAVPGVNPASQDWSAYETAMVALQDGLAADGVMLVPQLHGNNAGVLAGRLCNRAVTVADTPMRVKTGSVIGLGDAPVDSNGAELTLATLQTLEANRFSVPAWYPDYDGIYWAEGRILDVEGGDFQVIENRRVMDKVARRMRVRAIGRIGDRQLNSTPGSTAAAITYFGKDLREMSRSAVVNGVPFPGEIMPPEDGDIVINWVSKNEVAIYASAQPYDCPKKITINIMLDLSLSNGEA